MTEERGHGRLEKRECWVMRELDFLEQHQSWKDLNALVRVRSTRTVGQKTSVEERFYLTSMRDNAALILRTSRLHWGIENQLHWVLDVVFDDDASKVKNRIAAQNWVMVRQMAAHLLRREGTGKGSLAAKQFRATMDLPFLEQVLTLR